MQLLTSQMKKERRVFHHSQATYTHKPFHPTALCILLKKRKQENDNDITTNNATLLKIPVRNLAAVHGRDC